MSMHIVGPWLSTTSTKKRKAKVTKRQQEELERGWRDRNQRLKEMHLPKETFEQYLEWVYGKGSKKKTQTESREVSTSSVATKNSMASVAAPVQCLNTRIKGDKTSTTIGYSKDWITGPVSSKPSPIYTGTKILGIGTMHKSNAVPIFSDDEAIEISRMRR